jgi:membrane-bound lytic murein transglycosylase B
LVLLCRYILTESYCPVNMRKLTYILIYISLCLLNWPATSFAIENFAEQKQQFIDRMVTKYHFDRKYISDLIHSVKILPLKRRIIYEEKPWYIYRELFINEDHVKAGIEYWQSHAKVLSHVEKEYGVPTNVIVAILGVESHYGHEQGLQPALNILVTLAFTPHYETRFYQYELEQYFLLTRELNLDPHKINGSCSGALGYPQFMPGAYRKYAIDYDNNGKKDLFHDTSDVIASIANFVKDKDWHQNELIAVPAIIHGNKYKEVLNKQLATKFTVAELRKYSVKPAKHLSDETQVNLIRIRNKQNYEYWLGLHNFYVITHYNNNLLYAMAIYQLSERVEKLYHTKRYVQNRITASSKRRDQESRGALPPYSA